MAWEIGLSELLNKKLTGKEATTPKQTLLYSNVSNSPTTKWTSKSKEELNAGVPDWKKAGYASESAYNSQMEKIKNKPSSTPSTPSKGPEKTNNSGSQNSGSQNTKSSKTSSSKSSSKSSQTVKSSMEKDLERQREMARQAKEQQAGALRGGLEGSYTSSLSALEQLLQSLDPQYQSRRQDYERTVGEGTQKYQQELEKNKQADQNRLATLFSSYGTGDSEQRAQAQERMYGEYQRGLQDYLSGVESQKQTYLSDLDRERAERENEIAQRRMELQGSYQKGLGDIDAERYGGIADVEQNFAQLLQQTRAQEEQRAAAAAQQDFENRLAVQKAGSSGAGSSGFTASQAQKIQSDYNNDLQKALGKAAYMGQGGREQVYNEMLSRYGNVFDEQSIYQDIFGGFAQDGWEDQYKQMYKNPTDPMSMFGFPQ